MQDIYFNLRDGLENTYIKLTQQKKLSVAYMGGSVTYGIGASDWKTTSYRALVTKWLRENFVDATITEYNMAVGNACSDYGVYIADYVGELKPDLVFVEFAINDGYQIATNSLERISVQYETMIRKLREANPNCDIVALYITDLWATFSRGNFDEVKVHEKVAAHYGVPSVNVGLWLRQEEGLLSDTDAEWSEYFTDVVHPTDKGFACYAKYICKSMDSAFEKAECAMTVTNHMMPAMLNTELLNTKTYYAKDIDVENSSGVTLVNSNMFGLPNHLFPQPGVTLKIPFIGTEVAIFLTGGKSYSWSIDDGQYVTDTRSNPAYPIVLSRDLTPGQHTLALKFNAAPTYFHAVFVKQ